ncbi:MarR family transcriptional regulator [Oxalobacter vibrioformis]|uniref:MarR family transcriptional regulator n=1 Tax=Oxalobacter vibrioformis TaxID=933080 RepID=A0A9E9M1S8_9BURK|nr:MarR family transcriptional regulator [Oxalobacter vibrioformis]WAW10928.1 MarR family transcriptional regulator [Oxalobacter vibrioformis]
MKKTDTTNRQVSMPFLFSLFQVAHLYRTLLGKFMSSYGKPGATALPVLVMAYRHHDVRPGELADALGRDPSSVVRITDLLVKNGLAEREEDQQDRRAKKLRLTSLGRRMVEQMEIMLNESVSPGLGEITDQQLLHCMQVLNSLKQGGKASGLL